MNVLVTGGAGGLGLDITKQLAFDKANNVYFTYMSSIESARLLVKQFPNTTGIKCNFNNPTQLQDLCNSIEKLDIQVLINNAWGPLTSKHFHKFKSNELASSFNSNVLPTIQLTQSSLKYFKTQKQGSVITVLSSVIVGSPPTGWSAYNAEKHYLAGMNKSWASEYAKYNITCNCVSPSMMRTNMTKDIDERVLEKLIQNHPRKELLTTHEVAKTVISLIKMSRHINGVNLIMNAGVNVL